MEGISFYIVSKTRDLGVEVQIEKNETYADRLDIRLNCSDNISGELFSFVRRPYATRVRNLELWALREVVYELIARDKK
jgi:hypothetical protein